MNVMGIYYKQDICELLRKVGYTSYTLHMKGILSYSEWTKMEKHKLITWNTLDRICTLLQVQPDDLIGYREDEKDDSL